MKRFLKNDRLELLKVRWKEYFIASLLSFQQAVGGCEDLCVTISSKHQRQQVGCKVKNVQLQVYNFLKILFLNSLSKIVGVSLKW